MRTRRLTSRGEDRGAVLVIFAVFAMVAVVLLAAVVDLGGQREQRKEVTLSTDAAALAGASFANTEDPVVLLSPNGTLIDCAAVGIAPDIPNPDNFLTVEEVVHRYLEINGESQPVDCRVVRSAFKKGYVVVSADEVVDYAFGPALGIASGAVSGASVAAIDPLPGGGLRPIGLCGAMVALDVTGPAGFSPLKLNDLWNSTSAGYDVVDSYVVKTSDPSMRSPALGRFAIDKVKGGDCSDGSGAGNFGKLDFGGETESDCGNSGFFCHDLENGYYGQVELSTKGDTGNYWTNSRTVAGLSDLLSLGQFWTPVYDTATDNGGNTDFAVKYFAQMKLKGYCVSNGAGGSAGVTASPCWYDEPSGVTNATYFDFEISRMLPFGDGTVPITDDALRRSPRLCAVTSEDAAISAGCPEIVLTPTTTTSTEAPTTTTTTAPNCVLSAGPTSTPVDARGTVSGSDFTLNTDIVFVYTVSVPADCSAPSATFSTEGDSFTVTPQGPNGANGNEYTVTLIAGSTMKKNKTYTVTFSATPGLSDSVARVAVPLTDNP